LDNQREPAYLLPAINRYQTKEFSSTSVQRLYDLGKPGPRRLPWTY